MCAVTLCSVHSMHRLTNMVCTLVNTENEYDAVSASVHVVFWQFRVLGGQVLKSHLLDQVLLREEVR